MSFTIPFIIVIALFIGLIIFYASEVRSLNQKLKDAQWEAVAANSSWENEQMYRAEDRKQFTAKINELNAKIAELEKELEPLRVKDVKLDKGVMPVRKVPKSEKIPLPPKPPVPPKTRVVEDSDKRAKETRKVHGSYGHYFQTSDPLPDNSGPITAAIVATSVYAGSDSVDSGSPSCDAGSPSCD